MLPLKSKEPVRHCGFFLVIGKQKISNCLRKCILTCLSPVNMFHTLKKSLKPQKLGVGGYFYACVTPLLEYFLLPVHLVKSTWYHQWNKPVEQSGNQVHCCLEYDIGLKIWYNSKRACCWSWQMKVNCLWLPLIIGKNNFKNLPHQ